MDLLTSSESHPKPEREGQGEERKDEDGDILSPLQSGPPPLGSSDVTTPTPRPPGPPAPLNPMSSVVNMKIVMYMYITVHVYYSRSTVLYCTCMCNVLGMNINLT